VIARRTLLAALPAAAAWAQPPELRFGIAAAENERDSIARFEPFLAYMRARLQMPVRIHRATDYAGIIEAMNAGHVELARIGPANYALAHRVLGDRVAPIATEADADGRIGSVGIVFVRADSPFHTLDDLRGRSFAFADPNSTSGFVYPSHFLRREGRDPATFFGRTMFSGGHEQSIVAVANRAVDAAATFWNSPTSGAIQRMAERGMMRTEDFRILWRSPVIPNGPWVIRTDLPAPLRATIADALIALPERDPQAWRLAGFGAARMVPAAHEDYADVIAVAEENARARRQRP
jgi:phosphonate transport system substrate-binding protein